MKKKITAPSSNDEKLKTIVVLSILIVWVVAVIVGLFYPDRRIDSNITTMMGAVVGYFLVDKVMKKKDEK